MQPFLALITPLSQGTEPPGPGTSPGVPTHPIYIPPGPVDPGYSPPWARPGPPVYPDNTLPGNQPYPDQGLPGQQPRPDHGLPPFPSHPIYLPPGSAARPPLGIWGPTDPRPTPPIYIPPVGAQPPLGIWGPTDPRPGYGLPGPQPHPEHPIVIPPDLPPTTPEGGKIEWKTAWTPQTGWIVIGIPAEGTLVPTPSKT